MFSGHLDLWLSENPIFLTKEQTKVTVFPKLKNLFPVFVSSSVYHLTNVSHSSSIEIERVKHYLIDNDARFCICYEKL